LAKEELKEIKEERAEQEQYLAIVE